ncbi:hypothetical protein BH10PSE19_BH10PSE19_15400 [soil metagenome]
MLRSSVARITAGIRSVIESIIDPRPLMFASGAFSLTSAMTITPPDRSSLQAILRVLDKDSGARRPYYDKFVPILGGPSFFTMAGSQGLAGRHEFIPFLDSDELMAEFSIKLEKYFKYTYDPFLTQEPAEDSIKGVLYETIGSVLLGITKFEPELFQALCPAPPIETFSPLSAAEPPKLGDLFLRAVGTQENLDILKHYPAQGNLLTSTVAKLIEKQHPSLNIHDYIQSLSLSQFQHYLKHEDIHGLAFTFLAVDNLATAMQVCMQQYISNPLLYPEDKDAMGVPPESKEQISPASEKRNAFIKEVLRCTSPVHIQRSTSDQAISVGKYHIPPHCLVNIDITSAQMHESFGPAPGYFDPARFLGRQERPLRTLFSTGVRSCPAKDTIVPSLLRKLMEHILPNSQQLHSLSADDNSTLSGYIKSAHSAVKENDSCSWDDVLSHCKCLATLNDSQGKAALYRRTVRALLNSSLMLPGESHAETLLTRLAADAKQMGRLRQLLEFTEIKNEPPVRISVPKATRSPDASGMVSEVMVETKIESPAPSITDKRSNRFINVFGVNEIGENLLHTADPDSVMEIIQLLDDDELRHLLKGEDCFGNTPFLSAVKQSKDTTALVATARRLWAVDSVELIKCVPIKPLSVAAPCLAAAASRMGSFPLPTAGLPLTMSLSSSSHAPGLAAASPHPG